MSDQDTLTRKAKKFLFDMHNFDEDESIGAPEPPAPPPVFSEAEVEEARKDAFEQGRKQAQQEEAASREQAVATLVNAISGKIDGLVAAEAARAGLYEAESISLCRAIFARLFPELNRTHGLDEVEAVIKNVLEAQRHEAEIIIEVGTDFVGDIRLLAEQVSHKIHGKGAISVNGDPTMQAGDCRVSWNEGGAERSASRLAEEIRQKLEDTLAGRPALHDNREEISTPPADTPASDDQGESPDQGDTR